jgi:hypothetical protein
LEHAKILFYVLNEAKDFHHKNILKKNYMLGNMPLQENMVFVSGRIDQKVSQMSYVQLDQNVILDKSI